MKEFAVTTLIRTPRGIPLVRNPGGKVWKFPGGHGEWRDRDAEAAACRELLEETGILVPEWDLRLIFQEERYNRQPPGKHMFYAFMAELDYAPVVKKRGSDGEEIRFFREWHIPRMQDFGYAEWANPILRRLVGDRRVQLKAS